MPLSQRSSLPDREIIPARRSWWVAAAIVLAAVLIAVALLAAAIWFQRSDGDTEPDTEDAALVQAWLIV